MKPTPTKKKRTAKNVLFPGRPNYVGPTSGWFGLLHHSELFETSHDVSERIDYVKANKPKAEVAIRLRNMVYLGAIASTCAKCAPLYADYEAERAPLLADYNAKCAPLDADYLAKRAPLLADFEATKRAPLLADFEAKRVPLLADYQAKRVSLYADYQAKRAPLLAEVLAYIRSVMPDCTWNGKKLTGTTD